MMILYTTDPCPNCDKSDEIELDEDAVRAWKRGMYIQNAFPDMTPGQREQLITGIHEGCWDEYMGPEPD